MTYLAYLLWSSPLLGVVVLMAMGRRPLVAALGGAIAAMAVAVTEAPQQLGVEEALDAAGKGIWLAWLVGLVILAGLFLRESLPAFVRVAAQRDVAKRREAFEACFLIGPFVECATGFGVGQIATVAMLRGLSLTSAQVVLLTLFSQSLVPWGAMANATMVGAELAGLPVKDLGVHTAICTTPVLVVWLVIFWRTATRTGLPATGVDKIREAAWIAALLAILVIFNAVLGPEVAALATLGVLIAFRFWLHHRSQSTDWGPIARLALPYVALTVGLASTRSISTLNAFLAGFEVKPFSGAPAWFPLLHPATWLAAVTISSSALSERRTDLWPAAKRAWFRGRGAVLTIAVYLVIAKVMADSGMAAKLASALENCLGPSALVVTPWLAGAFGFLTGSGNATNGLLMSSQVALASEARFPLPWAAAIQNTAAAGLTMLSPARVAMACALVGDQALERATYAKAWPLGVGALAALSLVSGAILVLIAQ